MMESTWFDHLYFFIISILLPGMALMSEMSSKKIEELGGEVSEELGTMSYPPKKHIYYTNGLILVLGAVIVLTLWNVTLRSFAGLGFAMPIINIYVIGFSIALVLIYAIDTYFNYKNELTQNKLSDLNHVMPSTLDDYKHFIFLAFAAGICEEIIFRGFLINYILANTVGSDYAFQIAFLLPSFVFAISHIYQGLESVFKIFTISLLFGAIYIHSQSLLIVMVIHVLVDLISGGLMVKIYQTQKK